MNQVPNYRTAVRHYLSGFGLALVLTIIPFALVIWGGFHPTPMLLVIGAVALIQIVVHLYYFLHVDLSRQKRDDLILILFSSLILAIMAGGTIWIMYSLYNKMG